MSSNWIVPEGSPPQPSTTVQHQRDSLMGRRAISCSPNVGASRLPYNHTPSSAVNTPVRPYLSSHLLGLPSGQVACSFGSLDQYGARSHPTDATYPSLDSGGITLRQHTDHIGGASALGFEPGPAVGHPQAETYLGNQQDYQPPVLVVSADDSNCAPEFASAGMITGTCVYSDGLGTPHKPEPEQWDTPPVTVGAYIHSNQRMTLSFHQLRDSGSTGGRDLLSASSPYSFDYPSSPSACSPSSASPLSMLSNLGLNSPRSNMGDMDEGSSSRTYHMQECQAQGEPNWGASGLGVERAPVSPSSSPWPVNRTEPFGYELLQAISPMTPASANMAPIETPDPEGSPRMASISAPSQSFLTEGSDPFTCLTGGPSSSAPIDAFGPALQSDQAELSFSILPGTPDYQPSNVFGTSIMNSPPSEIPVISGGAGPFFSTQVNASYAIAPYRDYTYPISSMGANGSRNAVDIDAFHVPSHAKLKSRSTRGSIGKKCCRHRGTSRAKELENEDNNNDLLHMSISSLEENGWIQQASALKDTLRLIIRNCFADAPTRQEIVDLLFDVLPESIRVRVAEPGVKKYYKERIGHILSAPSNKSMFINSTGGRWSLGEGPSH